MSSASSTDPATGREAGMQPWHFFLLVAMVGATWAVIEARHTHPAALLLISAAVISAGLVAVSAHLALSGFFATRRVPPALAQSEREALEEEKALVLRSIKELEFDYGMRKLNETDYQELSTRLRARAVGLIEQLDRVAVPTPTTPKADAACPSCRTVNDPDARFCKSCGHKL
jgi:hypothetical protein